MELVCHECARNAFLLLPEDTGTVTAECLSCGASAVIDVAASSPAVTTRWDRGRQLAVVDAR